MPSEDIVVNFEPKNFLKDKMRRLKINPSRKG